MLEMSNPEGNLKLCVHYCGCLKSFVSTVMGTVYPEALFSAYSVVVGLYNSNPVCADESKIKMYDKIKRF